MTTPIVVIIMALAFAYIVFPFFRKNLRRFKPSDEGRLSELLSRKDISYSMLKELEFDYNSGILAEEDYRELEARYRKKAINVLKDLDNARHHNRLKVSRRAGAATPLTERPDSGDEIEQQIGKLRKPGVNGKRPENFGDDIEERVSILRKKSIEREPVEDRVEKEIEQLRSKISFCPKCGVKTGEDDSFCSKCGVKLSR